MTQPVKSPVSNPPFWMTPTITRGRRRRRCRGRTSCSRRCWTRCWRRRRSRRGRAIFSASVKKVFTPTDPPQTIISLSVQTATCDSRSAGALVVLVGVQLSVLGSYLPPVLNGPLNPPETIISLRVQTAVCWSRPAGAFVVLVAVQLSVLGLYRPPVFTLTLPLNPPQTIISLSVQTAM